MITKRTGSTRTRGRDRTLIEAVQHVPPVVLAMECYGVLQQHVRAQASGIRHRHEWYLLNAPTYEYCHSHEAGDPVTSYILGTGSQPSRE